MNLFEKIDLFYKLAQQLESGDVNNSDDLPAFEADEIEIQANNSQSRMKKLASLSKRF